MRIDFIKLAKSKKKSGLQKFKEKHGITETEKRTPGSAVHSIGYSPKEKKWYGWSHRAIYGFGVGSKCKEGDCHFTPKDRGGKGKWTAKTIAGAKQMAKDFAEGVS